MALDKRKKILLPLIILASGYIAWQFYHLIFSKDSSKVIFESTLKHSEKVHPDYVPYAAHHENEKTLEELSSTKTTLQSSAKLSPLRIEKKSKESQPVITAEQSEYLRLLNRYNLLKLKHMLLEEEAAIAAAKQRIIKSRSEIASMGGDSVLLGEKDFDREDDEARSVYELVYLDYQGTGWNALLNRGGRFFEVHQGTRMVNGDQVISVNKEGVILKQKDQLFLVNFDGSRLISQDDSKKKLTIQVDQAAHFSEENKGATLGRLTATEKQIVERPLTGYSKSSDQKRLGENKGMQKSKVSASVKTTTHLPAKSLVQKKGEPATKSSQLSVQGLTLATSTPGAKSKISKSVEKVQQWFSGILSNKAEKNADTMAGLIKQKRINSDYKEKDKKSPVSQQKQLSRSSKPYLPEPPLLTLKNE